MRKSCRCQHYFIAGAPLKPAAFRRKEPCRTCTGGTIQQYPRSSLHAFAENLGMLQGQLDYVQNLPLYGSQAPNVVPFHLSSMKIAKNYIHKSSAIEHQTLRWRLGDRVFNKEVLSASDTFKDVHERTEGGVSAVKAVFLSPK